MCHLQQRLTTINRFKFGMTATQAHDALFAAYKVQVNRRFIPFRMNDELERQITAVSEWMTNPEAKPWLMLCGKCGNGKTTMVNAYRSLTNVFNVFTSNEYDQKMVMKALSAMDVAQECKKDYETFKRLMLRPTLAIDDIGTEPMELMDYGAKLYPITDLITKRYEEQLFTILTTNLTPKNIRERYGDRIADRLNEMAEKIVFENGSYRGTQPNYI